MSDNALEASGLSFKYLEQNKKNVLDDVSVGFKEGKITVLMGRSGCGKSTLAALLAGLYPENGGVTVSGGVSLFGRPLESYSIPERARSLSMMFQNADLQFCMQTLRKEMLFCLGNISCPPEEMEERISRAAEKTGMTDYLDRPFATLSGGEKQKAALSCIFLLGSRVILLDEPFANIDAQWAERIASMLEQMNKEQGTTVIVIDHSLDHWLDRFDELIIIDGQGHMRGGIDRKALESCSELFKEEGLRLPFDEIKRKPAPLADRPAAVALTGLTIDAGTKKRDGKKRVLTDAQAVFPKNAMTAVMGPSGCGKTTLFRTLLGQNGYSGSIRIGERELKDIRPKELFKSVGIVFQNPSNQFITQNVLQEVECGLAGRMVKKDELAGTDVEKEAIELLREFDLARYRKYSPYMLSQGQQRRLAVLAILAGSQRILLLDEPTYGQDDAMTGEIMRLLKSRMERDELTVIFSTHDRRIVERWADGCYHFSEGRLRYEGDGTL